MLTTTSDETSTPSARGFFTRIKKLNRLFLLTVVLPTLIAVLYFGFIASDVYLSESRFVVRTPTACINTSMKNNVLQKLNGLHSSRPTLPAPGGK
jgi:capsular polysaccharide transport system permease protein